MSENNFPQFVFKWRDVPNIEDIGVYIANGGYEGFKKALTMKPDDITAEVKASGLRGRGGAGFSTGTKWGFLDKRWEPCYLVANDDEAEPCTFKDRELTERLPHQILEGMMIASYALGVHKAFIYIRGEFVKGRQLVWKAIRECHEKGLLGKNILGSGFDLDIVAHPGAGAYICGEETSQLNSLQGDRAYPRIRPPFPANKGGGLYGQPTVINNVETLSTLPHILLMGGKAYADTGGTRLFSVSGHVQTPGNYELPLTVTLQQVIDRAGGLRPGRKVKAVVPGGASMPWLTDQHLDVVMDFDPIQAAGSFAGSGAVTVMDDTTCVVKAAWRLAHFFKHESCGWCTPCREGTDWLEKLCLRVEQGQGKMEDIDVLLDMVDNISGVKTFGTHKTFCVLGPSAGASVRSSITFFRDEWEYHVKNKKCMVGG